ncbi:MAG TPA: M28 family peptidase [Candidatus Angelobacter sp.]|jgi:hypothetical protein|nr:M28 family peptidase [Candidatus Angelobacter sp.]
MNRVAPRLTAFKPLLVLVAFVASFLGADGSSSNALPPVPPAVETITPAELRMHLDFLASKELGGRYTLAPNFAVAARYLASHLKAYGFRGAAPDGDFLQFFDVATAKADSTKTSLSCTIKDQTSSYKLGDFLMPGLVSDIDVQGPVVFVGYGLSSTSQKYDDYAGLDVKGKIVLYAPGVPEGVDPSKLGDQERGEKAAHAHGAIGVLALPAERMLNRFQGKGFKERSAERELIGLANDNVAQGIPLVVLGPDPAEKLLASVALDLKTINEIAHSHGKLKPQALEASAHLMVDLKKTKTLTQNVAGILDGTDPELRKEYVVFSAHYDHLKTNDQGQIYPGADDDGSGTTAVLAIAHAMSLSHPKRSVLIIFHAGEELGLLGSEYNTDVAPVVPLDKMVVDLNIDMIGRSKPAGDTNKADEHLTDANTVYLVGSNRISQELHKLSEETNNDYQKLNLNYYYNDPENPERIYYRSDHWNYAKHGIPIIFYFDGVHADYHRTTDTVDKIDFTKLSNIAKLVFETGWRIANLDHRLANDAKK